MGYDTMSAWDRTAFEFNDQIQQRGGVWTGRIPWNSATGRTISQDDYKPPSPVELPAAPLFRDATASWSPPASPTTRSRSSTLSPPMSPRADSALCSPVMALLTAKEKRKLGEKLYSASCAGDLAHIKLLLSLGAPVNSSMLVKELYESFKPAKSGMLSPLAGAAGHRQLDVVELLLAEGAELNPHVNHSSSSPLHEAVRADDIELARFLLELGANASSLNAYKTTPLMYAVKYSSADMVRLLLSYKPDLNQVSFIGTAAVHWAVWPNRPEILELLLQAGADKDHQLLDGSTLLHCAVKAEHKETVECLLRFGADPQRRNDAWQTPLQVAEEGGCVEIARMLREATLRRHTK
ncbi:hypothetical protein LTR91_011970 [Friedmanniomyces endolithicus]|uniref:Uncharacterized protein n=2 Tax=Dothideomycetidae TaxID=451867 RepID=A0A4V6WK15_9PEZI|nr:hypothetical protein LTS09_008528 [Friedmanniomyces endolithicus]KAK5142480.1 hypothetical protein LTR32_005183 [Rachicladosporium monterosium]KAK0356260.1 hypothetical protein LTR94_005363 [Friedmanniomyces endolithicus]KAK0793511.1 hypothetical protein LTR59_008133 [Friedmanniomyces endolithicus]KAK0801491.1 hypothetical protein LTR38_006797 [Friedmanniomyces endolithicus]